VLDAHQGLSLAIWVDAHLHYLLSVFAAQALRSLDVEVAEQGLTSRTSSWYLEAGFDSLMFHDQNKYFEWQK
jgi:hypothetical protein